MSEPGFPDKECRGNQDKRQSPVCETPNEVTDLEDHHQGFVKYHLKNLVDIFLIKVGISHQQSSITLKIIKNKAIGLG